MVRHREKPGSPAARGQDWRFERLPVHARYLVYYLLILTVFWVPFIISNMVYATCLVLFKDHSGIGKLVGSLSMTLVLVGTGLLLFYLLRGRLDRPSWNELGFQREGLHIQLFTALKFVALIQLLEYVFSLFSFGVGIDTSVHRAVPTLATMVITVIASPIFEELVYRVNAATLVRRGMGPARAALFVSIWFIAKHVFFWRFEEGIGWPGVFYVIGYSILLWWIISYGYLKKRTILIPFLYHLYNNLLIALHYVSPMVSLFISYAFILSGFVYLSYLLFGTALRLPDRIGGTGMSDMRRWVGRNLTGRSLALWALAAAGGLLLVFTTEPLVFTQYIHVYLCYSVGLVMMSMGGATIIILMLVRWSRPDSGEESSPWDMLKKRPSR